MHPKHELLILTVNRDGQQARLQILTPRVWALALDIGLETNDLPGTESGAGPFSAHLSPIFTLGQLARSWLAGYQRGLTCFAHEVTLCVYFGSVLIPGSQHCLSHWGKVNTAYTAGSTVRPLCELPGL